MYLGSVSLIRRGLTWSFEQLINLVTTPKICLLTWVKILAWHIRKIYDLWAFLIIFVSTSQTIQGNFHASWLKPSDMVQRSAFHWYNYTQLCLLRLFVCNAFKIWGLLLWCMGNLVKSKKLKSFWTIRDWRKISTADFKLDQVIEWWRHKISGRERFL